MGRKEKLQSISGLPSGLAFISLSGLGTVLTSTHKTVNVLQGDGPLYKREFDSGVWLVGQQKCKTVESGTEFMRWLVESMPQSSRR